jgi:hypothetical protein
VSDMPHSAGPIPTGGGIGHTHEGGPGQKRGFTRRERWLAFIVLGLCLVMSGGALLSQQLQQNNFQNTIARNHARNLQVQAAQAAAVDTKLCAIFLPIAALKAPPGDGGSNPSRLFEQQLEAKLSRVASALDCKQAS